MLQFQNWFSQNQYRDENRFKKFNMARFKRIYECILWFIYLVLFEEVCVGIQKALRCMEGRYCPIFFDKVGYQTMSAYIENKHFFTKSCHHQTYQNYEQPPQSLQNLHFQSHFLGSKINKRFSIFFSVKNVWLGDQLL